MAQGIYLKTCCGDYYLSKREPKSSFQKNMDIILLVVGVIFATLAPLCAYRYIPLENGMLMAGGLAVASSIFFTQGLVMFLKNRKLLIVKDIPQTATK